MKNYFETLRDALDAVNISDLWPIDLSVAYGETVDITINDLHISVYRSNTSGRYELPLVYSVV